MRIYFGIVFLLTLIAFVHCDDAAAAGATPAAADANTGVEKDIEATSTQAENAATDSLHKDAHNDEAMPQHTEHYKDGQHMDGFDHESVLGSKAEAEEFSHLSDEEAKKRLGFLVQHMDANKDGLVDKDELTQWVNSSMRSLDTEEAIERFNDTDGIFKDEQGNYTSDGFVTWEEYFYFSHGERWNQSSFEDLKNEPKKYQEEINEVNEKQELYKEADANGDGKLSRDEYLRFQHPWNYREMHNVKVLHHLREDDKNKDNKVDFDEFVGEEFKNDTTPNDVARYKKQFGKFDTNQNGVLEPQEFKAYLVYIEGHVSQIKDEVDHLFNETDVSAKDGYLTKDEILDKHKLWVGSAPTDHPTVRSKFQLEDDDDEGHDEL